MFRTQLAPVYQHAVTPLLPLPLPLPLLLLLVCFIVSISHCAYVTTDAVDKNNRIF